MMSRATEDHVVKPKEGGALQGQALTKFLLSVQEYDNAAIKMARRLRDPRLVDLLAAGDLEKKSDFEDKKSLEKLLKATERAKLELDAKINYDEEHSLYELLIPGNVARPGDKKINWAFASTPEFKRLRASAKSISELDHPPFTVTRNGDKVVKEKASDVLAYVLEDAQKEFTITRFKGLGEMNPEQLWDTTMNAETRTLLKVRLEDGPAAEEIFSTLMGENVESRRKFIEENALEVVNLDI
jgi:DNA gyrase subunit B